MVALMSDLLEAGRREEEAEVLEIRPIDYGAALRRVLETFNGELEASGSALTLEIAGDVEGEGDDVLFAPIVTNLLSNAVKYGEGQPIEVALTGEGEAIRLSVRDRGIGIAPEERDTIFGRFHRADADDETDSYGLGLWIVKKAVDTLGGTIEFDSTPGDGTTFVVELPRQISE
jgi:signal transduction histidine kinase